ncbi:uncharacterized protein LOC125661559 [Ostrea edulis]|uniref:uncharacterized protein LOC125661559 n=1 Tax=Ostrea edulis TaxID=37623 RepID=UPI002094C7F7|nr:uncharacterized protein LOC125661559 [Ostrea edulis]
MEHIPRLSEAVYVGMFRIAGTPTQVSIRREMLNNVDRFGVARRPYFGMKTVMSGSRTEGFDLKESDWDFMSWPFNHKLISNFNQVVDYDIDGYTLILMENCEDRPGFVLLQLLTLTNDDHVHQSCVIRDNKYYIKSSKFRENMLTRISLHPILHGPCASGTIGDFEFDSAYCFRSDYWPPIADQFIDRCRARGWPARNVLEDIIGDGCHAVPIGLKGSPQEDSEWRMSFSAAELKLVHSMNHTQFICYALLKVFLKEALAIEDVNGQPLLCSYFMKTTLFWVIQSNSNFEWSPPNLLSGFWMCFKGLLASVQRGYLPNFFIPENNMFRSKIHGHSQELVCSRMYELYNIGIACLLHCPSVRDFFMQAILHREFVVSTAETDIVSTVEFETVKQIDMLREILRCCCSSMRICFMVNRSFLGFSSSIDLSTSGLVFEVLSSDLVRYIANHLWKFPANNRLKLKLCRSCEALLKLRVRFGCLSETVYLALFYCISGENQKALPILETLRRDITQPYVIHNDRMYVQTFISGILGGRSFMGIMKKATLTIHIYDEEMIIKELEPEQREAKKNHLQVPPYIMTLMLLIVCNHGNSQKQQEVLHELYDLLHSNIGRYVRNQLRDISWQILGICQQICGDHKGALLSYQESLRQEPFHEMQEATKTRMQDARSRI